MTKKEFRAKSADLHNIEVKLKRDTHKTLYDMLWSMHENEGELQKLAELGIEITDTDFISSINGNGCTFKKYTDGSERNVSLDALSYEQQTQIMYCIFKYIWEI